MDHTQSLNKNKNFDDPSISNDRKRSYAAPDSMSHDQTSSGRSETCFVRPAQFFNCDTFRNFTLCLVEYGTL